ncbi:MAG: autotransporter assembly complex protein TamA [Methylobacteriaceae bacterium]|nr:autotransporter assembly complex protein TamA [Methylobacteriaceae bacterium]
MPGFLDRLFGGENNTEVKEVIENPTPYTVRFTLNNKTPDQDGLEDQLKGASMLEENSGTPCSGMSDLVRRAVADQTRMTTALEALGFFNGRVDIRVDGHSIIDRRGGPLPRQNAAYSDENPVPVEVVVDAGDLFRVAEVTLTLTNNRVDYVAPSTDTLQLQAGAPARSSLVRDAESRLITDAMQQGFAFARLTKRDIRVDHKNRTMTVALTLNPGPRAHFGETKVVGATNLPGFIEKRITWKPGDVYSPEAENKLRAQLQKHPALRSVRVRDDYKHESTAEVPVTIEAEERAPRYIGFSGRYSTTEGAALNAYWGHRNLFGGAEQLRLEATMTGVPIDHALNGKDIHTNDKIGFRFAATYTQPEVFSVYDEMTLIPSYVRDVTEYYTREGFLASATYRYHYSDKLTFEAGIDYEHGKITRFDDPSFVNDKWYSLVGVPLSVTWDNTNSLLDPTRGVRVSATVAPYYTITGSDFPLYAKGTVSAYLPLDEQERFVLAGKLGVGSILNAKLNEIAPPRRFFAGGGGSVRGYDYKSLGPKNPNDWVIGGRSIVEASAELRVKITDTIGVVAFMDAGNAYLETYPDFSQALRYSAGLGLRYYTPIGPLRLDVARGLNREKGDPQYGVYISIGQAF